MKKASLVLLFATLALMAISVCFLVKGLMWSQKMVDVFREEQIEPREGEGKVVWKYSVEYLGKYYDTYVRHYERKQYVSGEWVDREDVIDVNVFIKCDCGNFLEMIHPYRTADMPLEYTCSKCDKTYEFVLDDGILVTLEDTVLDDEELFIRSHYVRYIQPN